MPYQRECQDGFVINRFLKKPKARGGLIYTALDEETVSIHGGRFLPTWDSTDHFHFICEECKSVADVLRVKFDANYGGGVKYALFFYLGCRKCGASGQRKIYLDRRRNACKFQRAHDEGKVYIYADGDQPNSVISREKIVMAELKVLKEKLAVTTIDEALQCLEQRRAEAERGNV
jgi:hypothetical protein